MQIAEEEAVDVVSPELSKLFTDIEQDSVYRSSSGSAVFTALAASRTDDSLEDLVHAITSNAALTERLLKVVNSAAFRIGGAPVQDIRRAVMLVGYDSVKVMAMLLSLVDDVEDEEHREMLSNETARSTAAASFSKELALALQCDPDRAMLQAVLCSLGRIMVATKMPAAFKKVQAAAKASGKTEAEEARAQLGLDFNQIAAKGALSWNLPQELREFLGKPTARLQGTGLAASIGNSVADALCARNAVSTAQVAELLEQFTRMGGCTRERATNAIESGQTYFRNLARSMGLPDVIASVVETATEVSTPEDMEPAQSQPVPPVLDQGGRPANYARALQEAALELSQQAARGESVPSLVTFTLEAFVALGGFQRAVLLVRDTEGRGWATDRAVGRDAPRLKQTLRLPVTEKLNLLSAALERDKALVIDDATAPKVVPTLPGWFQDRLPAARGFMLLPLAVRGRTIAAIYLDRAVSDGMSNLDLPSAMPFKNLLTLALRAVE